MNIAFLITTFNRPVSFLKVANYVKQFGDVYVVNDGSKLAYKYPEGIQVIEKENGGKKKYYETVTILWNMVKNKDYDYYFMIPDDMMPINDFHKKAIMTYHKIYDYQKIAMNIYTEKSRYMKPCWTEFQPIMTEHAILTNWLDMAFMCEKEFFELLNYRVKIINRNWEAEPELGSSVGAYISLYCYNRNRTIYQTKTSMLIPMEESHKSQMNKGRENSLINQPVL